MRIRLLAVLACLPCSLGAQVRVASPDGRNVVMVDTHEGRLSYAVQRDGRPLLTPSMLGFQFRGSRHCATACASWIRAAASLTKRGPSRGARSRAFAITTTS